MKKALLTLAIIILAIFSSCDLGLEMVQPEEGSVNAYIYPYFQFELSDDLTYYTVTVVAGAQLEILNIPGEFHTDFGSMPIKKFGGYENPEDAANLKEIHLGANIEFIEEDALRYAYNLQVVEHENKGENSKWAYLPKLKKSGCHFIGWQAGDDLIWEETENGYVQNVYEVNPEHTVATPVFVELIKVDAVLPTCTESGVIEHFYCEHCEKNFSDADGNNPLANTIAAALGHYLVENQYKAPTCQTTGLENHYLCERCNENFEDAEGSILMENVVISKVEHAADGVIYFNNDIHYTKCVWCRVELNKEDHELDEGVIFEDMFKVFSCLGCDYQIIEEITDHEHKLGEDKVHYEATCTEPEYNIGPCIICGRESREVLGKSLGHDFISVEYIEATCQIEGIKQHSHCNRCDLNFENESDTNSIDDVVIAKLDHRYKESLSHDDEKHWFECKTCDPAIGEVAKKEFAAHSYDQEVAKDQFLVSDATCTASAVYYKSCKCGVSSADTFEYGEPLGHEYEKEYGTLNYDYGKTDDDKEYHWLECIRCSEEKEGSRSKHVIDQENSTHRICGTCGFKTPKSFGGISVVVIDKAPAGSLVEMSQEGNVYTFKLEDEKANTDYRITSYRWETNGIAISEADGSTFAFEAPSKKTYTVKCIFSNEYGTMSISTTVRGGKE